MEQKRVPKLCPLCGKYKSEELRPVILGVLDAVQSVAVTICRSCDVILHNVRRIYKEAEFQWREKKKEDALRALNESPPSVNESESKP